MISNGVVIAVIAQAMVGASLVWDKILLKRTNTSSVVNYVFWLGAIGIFGCIVGVFGWRTPSVRLLLTGLASGAIDLAGSWAYYKALNSGEASQSLAIMGGFTPLATALISIPLLHSRLHGLALCGFALLVSGGFFMFLSEKINFGNLLPFVLLAAACLGLSNVLQRIVFEALGFPTGFVFFSIGQFVAALLFLARENWRAQIFHQSRKAQPRNKIAYFANRFLNGLGAFLVSFALSRAHPALVSALSGVRYATIFAGVYLITKYKPVWLTEIFSGWPLAAKCIATSLVIAGLAVLALAGQNDRGSLVSALFRNQIWAAPQQRALLSYPPVIPVYRSVHIEKHRTSTPA